MRHLLLYLTLGLLLACGTSRIRTTDTITTPADSTLADNRLASAGELEEMRSPLHLLNLKEEFVTDRDEMSQIMNFLASDSLKGRDTGSEGIERAASFIEDHFRKNKLTPYFDTFRDGFSIPGIDSLGIPVKSAFNIVGLVEGNDEALKGEYILIGAHYDHIGVVGNQPADSIANGANDNASGTATVLQLARYFGNARSNKRSLIFVLFSAEEKGLLGSHHLAGKLKDSGLNLYLMLNFEMTGVPLKDKDYFMFITGYERSNLASIFNGYSSENLVGFLPTAKEFNLFQRSDNYPFHLAFEIPSHTFCTFDFTNFNHYHKVGDEVQLMDMDHMALVVRKMIPVLERISNSPDREIRYH